jgi:alanyl-tRNA synthetase
MELCGGTHVANTAEIGLFKIVGESGVAAGIRRIEAVAGAAVLTYLNQRDAVVKALADRFKAQPEEIVERVTGLQEELKASQKSLAAARAELAAARAAALADQAELVGPAVSPEAGAGAAAQPFQLLVHRLDGVEGAGLQIAAQQLQEQIGVGTAVVLGGLPDPADLGKVVLVAAFGPQVVAAGPKAGAFIGGIAKLCGGGGGGRPNLAQAGGKDGSALDGALAQAKTELKRALN